MSELTRIERGHRRAMRWMKSNPGRPAPAAIRQALNEFHALEELRLQQQDKRLLEEWEADPRPVEEKGVPPIPSARQVVLPPRLAKGLILALAELDQRTKAHG
mgnify:FL=1